MSSESCSLRQSYWESSTRRAADKEQTPKLCVVVWEDAGYDGMFNRATRFCWISRGSETQLDQA